MNSKTFAITSKKNGKCRFIVTADDILFNAFDACVVLWFKNPKKALQDFLAPEEIFQIDVNNRKDKFITFHSFKKLAKFSHHPDPIRLVNWIDVTPD